MHSMLIQPGIVPLDTSPYESKFGNPQRGECSVGMFKIELRTDIRGLIGSKSQDPLDLDEVPRAIDWVREDI